MSCFSHPRKALCYYQHGAGINRNADGVIHKTAQTCSWNLEATHGTTSGEGCHGCRCAQMDDIWQLTRLRDEVARLRYIQ